MPKKALALLGSIFLSLTLARGQQVSGVVTHQILGTPVPGAGIYIDRQAAGKSDDNGRFQLQTSPGRHQLYVLAEGFQDYFLAELWVESGKPQTITVELSPLSFLADTVEVRDHSITSLLSGRRIISLEEVERLPAAFFDPARITITTPGITTVSDQANHLVIRGLSPNYMQWRLEGVEIVNPNHLSNAGTPTDRPMLNGGGVSLISAQLLSNSNVYTGVAPTDQQNALAGTLDLELRPGNNQKTGFTAQAGLIGLDVSAEGPLRPGGASFLANYRYSTLGLLNALGLSFGGEAIGFQDFAASLHLPNQSQGGLTLFTFLGQSTNVFEPGETPETFKDFQTIDYRSSNQIAGAKHQQLISNRLSWKSVLIYSRQHNARQSDLFWPPNSPILYGTTDDELSLSKTQWKNTLLWQAGARMYLKSGLALSLRSYRWQSITSFTGTQQQAGWSVEPFFTWSWEAAPRLKLSAGLTGIYDALHQLPTLGPQLEFLWTTGSKSRVRLAGNTAYQTVHPAILLSPGAEKPLLAKSHNLSWSYQYFLKPYRTLHVEAFGQQLAQLPMQVLDNVVIPTFNWLDDYRYAPFNSTGRARVYGVEGGLKQLLYHRLFYHLNASWYRSLYRSAGIWTDSRFAGNYLVNATVGREMNWSKNNKTYTLGFNVHGQWFGGWREYSIDELASSQSLRTEYENYLSLPQQLESGFRLNGRVYLRRDKTRYSSVLALDVQNATNNKNAAYHYFDPYLDRSALSTQLGIIPVVSYRISF